jgi:Zn-dependent alcohol dehydrogenase
LTDFQLLFQARLTRYSFVQILPQLIDLYKRGKFPVDKLAKIYKADSIENALDDLHSGSVIKPVLDWVNV